MIFPFLCFVCLCFLVRRSQGIPWNLVHRAVRRVERMEGGKGLVVPRDDVEEDLSNGYEQKHLMRRVRQGP